MPVVSAWGRTQVGRFWLLTGQPSKPEDKLRERPCLKSESDRGKHSKSCCGLPMHAHTHGCTHHTHTYHRHAQTRTVQGAHASREGGGRRGWREGDEEEREILKLKINLSKQPNLHIQNSQITGSTCPLPPQHYRLVLYFHSKVSSAYCRLMVFKCSPVNGVTQLMVLRTQTMGLESSNETPAFTVDLPCVTAPGSFHWLFCSLSFSYILSIPSHLTHSVFIASSFPQIPWLCSVCWALSFTALEFSICVQPTACSTCPVEGGLLLAAELARASDCVLFLQGPGEHIPRTLVKTHNLNR